MASSRASASGGLAVTFDLWQTLIFEADGNENSMARRDARTRYLTRELIRLGETVDQGVVRQGFTDLSKEITDGHDYGRDVPYERWISILVERLVPGLEQRVGAEEILEIGRLVDQTFLEAPPLLLEGTEDVLNELAERGLKIGLISNTGLTSPQMFRRWFRELEIIDNFDHLAFSNEMEVAKPDSRIFETTVRSMQVDAANTLHIGDNIHTDVGGAAAVGMSTVWVRGGTNSPVEKTVEPDYKVDSILEIPSVVDNWMGAR